MFADYPILCMVTPGRLSGDSRSDEIATLLVRIAAAAQAGVSLIQIREAALDGRTLCDLVRAAVRASQGTAARIIVNDRADVAIAAGAHGVHLKETSMPVARVRALVARPLIVGRSIHAEDAEGTQGIEGADYVIFGTVFETRSKPDRAAAGVKALQAVVARSSVPVLAIGGVTEETLAMLRPSGAAGFAAIGFFDVEPAALRERCNAARTAFDTLPPVP